MTTIANGKVNKTFLDLAETKKKLMNKIHQDLPAMQQEYINNKVGYYCDLISPVGHLISRRKLVSRVPEMLKTIFKEYPFTEGVSLDVLEMYNENVVVQVRDTNIHPTHSEKYEITRRVQPVAASNASLLQLVSVGKYANTRNYYAPNDIELMLSIITQELAEQAIAAINTGETVEEDGRLDWVLKHIQNVEQDAGR